MPMEVPRCTDCGAPLKAVPAWLATAQVSFTCAACPRRSTRGPATRFDSPAEPRSVALDDVDLDADEVDEIDEEADLDLPADEADDFKDDAGL